MAKYINANYKPIWLLSAADVSIADNNAATAAVTNIN